MAATLAWQRLVSDMTHVPMLSNIRDFTYPAWGAKAFALLALALLSMAFSGVLRSITSSTIDPPGQVRSAGFRCRLLFHHTSTAVEVGRKYMQRHGQNDLARGNTTYTWQPKYYTPG